MERVTILLAGVFALSNWQVLAEAVVQSRPVNDALWSRAAVHDWVTGRLLCAFPRQKLSIL